MKKMNAAAVFVLLMVSATNVFADATCADVNNAITNEKINIVEKTEEIKKLDDYIIETQTQILKKQLKSGDESFILGNGQELAQAHSVQLFRSRAQGQESILTSKAKIEVLKSEYMKACSGYDKFQ